MFSDEDIETYRQENKQRENAAGAAARYQARIPRFEKDGRPLPRLRHSALWLLHNCVVHPLLALAPGRTTRDIHDLSSDWLNHHDSTGAQTISPKPGSLPWWILHNAVAHPLIGLLPTKWTFQLHDESARRMRTRGWV